MVDDVARQWGSIDFLLNDAGASNAKSILEIKEEEFDRTIAVNLKSCFNYIHAIAPIMLKQDGGGRIASMSSLNALSGGVTSAVSKHAYAAAKAGILGLTRSLAKELGPKIMINAICPGVIETELGNSLTKVARRGDEEGHHARSPGHARRHRPARGLPRHLGALLHHRPALRDRRLPVVVLMPSRATPTCQSTVSRRVASKTLARHVVLAPVDDLVLHVDHLAVLARRRLGGRAGR